MKVSFISERKSVLSPGFWYTVYKDFTSQRFYWFVDSLGFCCSFRSSFQVTNRTNAMVCIQNCARIQHCYIFREARIATKQNILTMWLHDPQSRKPIHRCPVVFIFKCDLDYLFHLSTDHLQCSNNEISTRTYIHIC